MIEKAIQVNNKSGLHARPASILVKEAGAFQCSIHIKKNGKEVDAKSILGVMSLAVQPGETVTIKADGADEQDAIAKLITIIQSKFGE